MNNFSEFKLIQWLRQVNKEQDIGDDTAVINPEEGKSLLVTSDMLVEYTHFLTGKISPYQLGHKTLAVNLSDIAAMGGWPRYSIISTCWSQSYKEKDIKEFFEGLFYLGDKYQVKLIGGDTCKGRSVSLDLCLIGEVDRGKEVTRKGAKTGDCILLSGPVGTSAAGLELILKDQEKTHNTLSLSRGEKQGLLNAHLTPEPRVYEGYELGKKGLVTAMIDVSDGISSEVNHIARESEVGAIIYEEKIPITKTTKKTAELLNKDPLQWALKGGEDYQLLMCAKKTKVEAVKKIIEEYNKNYSFTYNQPTIIGEILDKRHGVKIKKENKYLELTPEGYSHF